jgi:uncharacterized MAPEG superfamily protein
VKSFIISYSNELAAPGPWGSWAAGPPAQPQGQVDTSGLPIGVLYKACEYQAGYSFAFGSDRVTPVHDKMLTPIQSLAPALALTFLPHFFKGFLLVKNRVGYDIATPRDNLSHAEKREADGKIGKGVLGQIKRAAAAHENGWEAFSYFAAAALAAHVTKVDPAQSSQLSTLFLISRFLYNILYVFNIGGGWLRAGMFGGGIYAAGKMMILAGAQ